jgi:LmbE family N-acetylglucosaminyl deacetylase
MLDLKRPDVRMIDKVMRKKEPPTGPRWKRALRSVGRIFLLLFLVLFFVGGGAYWWNPQRIHFRKKTPANFAKVDPDSAHLFSSGHRVTIVVGHPDDAEFFISGALLKLHDAGAILTLVVVTDGDKSYYPPFLTNSEENRRVRHQEQIDASSHYRARVVFLGGPDGRYNPDEPALRAKLKSAIDESKPETLIAFDPEYLPMIQHRDHENSGRATLELASKTTAKWILFFATTAKNYFVDTSKYWDKRSELVSIHKSQFYGEKLERVRGMLYEKEMNDGEEAGSDLAEGFRAIKLKD